MVSPPLGALNRYVPEMVMVPLESHRLPAGIALDASVLILSLSALVAWLYVAAPAKGPWGPRIEIEQPARGTLIVHSKVLSSDALNDALEPATELTTCSVSQLLALHLTVTETPLTEHVCSGLSDEVILIEIRSAPSIVPVISLVGHCTV
jgi:hypothetical protein